MSRKTTMETLKGGMLLMILLLLLLLIAGGIVRWRYGARDRGPAVKVTVNVQADARQPNTGAGAGIDDEWAGGVFPVPKGTVETSRAIDATVPGSHSVNTDIDGAVAGIQHRRIFCRTVARESDPAASVQICSVLFDDALDALVVFGRMSPGPSSLRMPGLTSGSVDPDGFHLVKGTRYFRIRRGSQTEDARAVAMAAVSMIASSAPAASDTGFERLLPTRGRVEGSWKIRSGTDIGLDFLGTVLTCDYSAPRFEMSLFMKKAGTTESAGKLLEQAIQVAVRQGAVEQHVPATESGLKVFQVGATLEVYGIAGTTVFGIRRASGITQAIELAREIILLQDGTSPF